MPYPLPSHIAWRVAPSPQALLSACQAVLARPGLTTARLRNDALAALLDREARAQGCLRAGAPRRWMTRAEYEAYREANPGYRRDPEAHRRAWQTVSARRRKRIGRAGARARWGK